MNHKTKTTMIFVLGALLALAACGKVGPLEARGGQTPAPKAIGQTQVQNSDALMTASEQARPGRGDEQMRRSERRSDDPFDLPPGNDQPPAPQPTSAPAQSLAPK
jgi:predicted small lipoprotein YifL